MYLLMQAKPKVTPPITKAVVGVVKKIDDATAMTVEIVALITYIRYIFVMREVVKERKQWEDDHQKKISEAIAKAMKQWDGELYPRLLQATWGWHPFYSFFLANPLCTNFISTYPLSHSTTEVGMCMMLFCNNPRWKGCTRCLGPSYFFDVFLSIVAYCPLCYYTRTMASLEPTLRNGRRSQKKSMELARMFGSWQRRIWKKKVSCCLQEPGRWICNTNGLQM